MRLLFLPSAAGVVLQTFGCFHLQRGGPFSSSPSQGTPIPSLSLLLLFVAHYFSFTRGLGAPDFVLFISIITDVQ